MNSIRNKIISYWNWYIFWHGCFFHGGWQLGSVVVGLRLCSSVLFKSRYVDLDLVLVLIFATVRSASVAVLPLSLFYLYLSLGSTIDCGLKTVVMHVTALPRNCWHLDHFMLALSVHLPSWDVRVQKTIFLVSVFTFVRGFAG
jgi:hypothetical protein